MICLGVDPGTDRLGVGVVATEGQQLIPLYVATISPVRGISYEKRLQYLYEEVSKVMAHYKPQVVGVEKLFFSRNVTTAMTVGEARGLILLAVAQANVDLVECTPSEVKQAVTGYGRADKMQVQQMVTRLLRLPEVPTPDDGADALAIAICTVGRYAFARRLGQ